MQTSNCKHQEADNMLEEVREGLDFTEEKMIQEGFSEEVALKASGGH